MSARRRAPRPTRPTWTRDVEWIGGIASLPVRVSGSGEPCQPEALFWMGADGAILGSTLAEPGKLLSSACETLESTIAEPMFGDPHRPTRVRVASADLADALRAGHPGLDVICAPTPELDAMVLHMREMLNRAGEPSYLTGDIAPKVMGAFFDAAASLFRAAPWKVVPDDQCLFSITIASLGVHDAVMSVIGQAGQSFGLLLFSGFDDFETYLDAAHAFELGEELEMPPHFAIHFERGADLEPALRREIAEHQWTVAGANAYPWVAAVDEDLVSCPPTGEEMIIAEALARALVHLLAEKKAIRRAFDHAEPLARTLSVTTHAGEIEITLRAPYTEALVDPDGHEAIADELARRFATSHEGSGLDAHGALRLVMDLGADYLGLPITSLDASDLRKVLFEILPRKVSVPASEARSIVDELRAFYVFAKRELGLKQADACLRVLGADAVKKLEAALSDDRNFGMAKSILMEGAAAGFDMQSKEGIEAWMQSMQGQPLPPSIALPGTRPRSSAKTATVRKNERKAVRKARKKNR